MGPLVNPGKYTLRLTVEGKTLAAPLDVLPDPRIVPPQVWAKAAKTGDDGLPLAPERILSRIAAPDVNAELNEQIQLALKIRDDITRLARMVEQLRTIRGQLVARNTLLKDEDRAKSLVESSRGLLTQLDTLEEKLHNPKAKIVYDILAQKGGARLYSQLVWLFEMMKDSDGAPSQGIREVFAEQTELLRKYQEEWRTLVAKDSAALNEQARKVDMPAVVIPTSTTKTD